MLVIKFDKWTDKKINVHPHGFTQTINKHYVNLIIFNIHWKILEWTEYVNYFHEDK